MTRFARQNLVAWAVIGAFSVLFMLPALHLPTGAKEEAPEASGEITMQQRLLVRVIDATAGLRPEANAHQLLLGLGNSVPPASAENPGEDLGNAAILARLGSVEGSKDSAIARLDALQKSISDGKAQATPESREMRNLVMSGASRAIVSEVEFSGRWWRGRSARASSRGRFPPARPPSPWRRRACCAGRG